MLLRGAGPVELGRQRRRYGGGGRGGRQARVPPPRGRLPVEHAQLLVHAIALRRRRLLLLRR